MMIAVFLASAASARADIAVGAGGTSLTLTGRVGAEDHCHAALAQPRDRLLILGPADLADRRRHDRLDRAAVARIANACDSLFALMGRPSAGRQGHAETGPAVGQVGRLQAAGMVADNAVADP
ncbi:hypothetical protein A6A05_13280 [Magnetospirillum moscoviense]|uniref:Uncharacterized protein n=2 Tax=Magnetospirillum moscoviense TaxID=1437059 RepID=A0A178MLK9_9PROT|nr:hypothetical protein A6A05_13280 [Magnetospirillum moscoviense]